MKKILLSLSFMLDPRLTYPAPAYILDSGHAEMQGRRPTMEDRHVLLSRFDNARTSFFAIFDGHGGTVIAQYASHFLPSLFERFLLDKKNYSIEEAFKKAFLTCDAQGRNCNCIRVRTMDPQYQYMNTNCNSTYCAYKRNDQEGSTALCVYQRENNMYIAHVGDSRAVLSKSGLAIALTKDHKPNDPVERARIEAAGGQVTPQFGRQNQILLYRVNNMLAVSRALGDYYLKKPAQLNNIITAEPDVAKRTITEQDEFIILACDGVWDVLSNQQAVDVVAKSLKAGKTAAQSAQELIAKAYAAGSMDNISALVVVFKSMK